MIPGDGIGPELMLHVKSVFRYGDPRSLFLALSPREDRALALTKGP